MFGIKTKKDKRIEELEEQLRYTYFKQPMIIENRGNVLTVASKVCLEDMMPVEYAKDKISRDMAENLKEYITYDVEQYSNGKKALSGYLKIVV